MQTDTSRGIIGGSFCKIYEGYAGDEFRSLGNIRLSFSSCSTGKDMVLRSCSYKVCFKNEHVQSFNLVYVILINLWDIYDWLMSIRV